MRGRLILGRTASFPVAVQRVADLGQRSALAMLARDDDGLTRIRTWPGRGDLGSDIKGLDDHELMRVVRRAVAARRLLILAMDDAVTTVAVPPPPAGRAVAAKPPPGVTLSPAQEKDAAVAALDMMDKVTAALQRSANHMGPELANAFLQLFTLDNLKVMAAFILAGALANTNPLSAAVFDGAMLVMVFYLAGSAGIEALGLLVTTTLAVIDAKSEADLDRAGEQYAKAFVGLGGALFMAWLARRIIKERNTGGGGGGGQGGRSAPPPAPAPTSRPASRNDRYLNDRTQGTARNPQAPPAGINKAASFGNATSNDYKATFFKANPATKGDVVVHHAVEQQVLERYPGVVTKSEMNSLENLRGIPNELNSDLHLSKIRVEWNRFYKPFDATGTVPSKAQLLQKATEIDAKYGHLFNPPL